jgi:hypothetical protein
MTMVRSIYSDTPYSVIVDSPLGSEYDNPIVEKEQGAGVDTKVRAQFSFANSRIEQAAVLRQAYGAGNVIRNDLDEWTVKKPDGKWYAIDPKGFDVGDIVDVSAGATQIVPEVIGGVGGAVLAAPTGPGMAAGGALGAGAGGAVGALGRQEIGSALGVPEAVEQQFGAEYLPGTQEKTEEVGRAFLFGAGSELAGMGALGLLGKSLAPMRAGLSRGAQAGMARARAMGVDLSLGDISGGRVSSLWESALSNLWGSSGVMQEFRVGQLKRLSELTDDWLRKFSTGTKISPTRGVVGEAGKVEVGTGAGAARETMQDTFQSLANGKYDEVAVLAGADTFGTPSLRGLADDIVGSPTFDAFPQEAKRVFKLLQEKAGTDMNFLEAQQWRSMLGSMTDVTENIPSAAVGQIKRLFGAINKDMAAYAGSKGGALQEAFDDATRFYRAGDNRVPGISLINGPTGKKLARLAKQPEDIIPRFFQKNNATELGELKRLVGDDAFKELKETWVAQDMLAKVGKVDVPTGGGDLKFTINGNALSKYLDDMGDETLKTIFSPTELRRLRRLASVAKQTKQAMRTADNPAGTAQVVLLGSAIAGLGGGALGDAPLFSSEGAANIARGAGAGALGLVLLPRLLAKATLSRGVRRYGTTGWSIPVGLQRTVAGAAPAAAREATSVVFDKTPTELFDPLFVTPRVGGERY